MANSFVGQGAVTQLLNNGASGNIAVPAGVQAGDKLVMMCGFSYGCAFASTPSGWSIGGGSQTPPNGGAGQPYYYEKVAGASEPSASVTMNNNGGGQTSTFIIFATRGSGASIFATNATDQGFGSASGSITTPNITTTVANSMLIGWVEEVNGHGGVTITVPGGLTSIVNNSSQVAMAAGYTLTTGAPGSYNPGSFTNGTAGMTYRSMTIAIAPAATAGPTIGTQPSNQTVTAGATATFTVAATASGGGTLSYQWQRNGTDISGATSASYTTPATTVTGGSANNGDAYWCNVTETGGTNAGTTTSSAATLTVNAASAKAGVRYFYQRGNRNV